MSLELPTLGQKRGGKPPIGGYVSQCKVCELGVYGSESYDWYGPPLAPLGISHTRCVGSRA